MATKPQIDDEDDFVGDYPGSGRRSGDKRAFGDLDEDEDDVFGSKKDLRMKKMIGLGHERDGLYYLDIPEKAFTSVSSSPLYWHYCLGHPSLAKLHQVVPILSSVSVLECEACQLCKHRRSSFPLRVESPQLQPFELVHTDIWGLSRVKNPKGFQYFVIFVDDCSKDLVISNERTI